MDTGIEVADLPWKVLPPTSYSHSKWKPNIHFTTLVQHMILEIMRSHTTMRHFCAADLRFNTSVIAMKFLTWARLLITGQLESKEPMKKPLRKSIEWMKYYLADPALFFYDASQGSCVEEFQVQMHPTWPNCPLRIRTVFSNHHNLVPDVFYNPNGKNWQGISIHHRLKGNRIVEGTTYPYVWIPVSRIHYEHIIQAKQAHKAFNPSSVQWNHNGKIHDPLGCHVCVGFTGATGTRPTYSCISDFGDQNLSITNLSTSIPCAEAFAIFRIDLPRAEVE